jgi:RNA polymerase-binding protein DksA
LPRPTGVAVKASKPSRSTHDKPVVESKASQSSGVRAKGSALEPSPLKAPEKKTFSLVQSSDIKVRRPLAPTRPASRPTPMLETPRHEPVRLPPAPVTTDAKPKRNRAGLSQRELAEFRDLLLAKRRELLGDMSSMEREALRSQGSNLSNLPVHMADMGTDNYEQEFTLGLVEKDRILLREINAALAKIQDGTYGLCEGTGQPISKARLEAQPWARYSIEYARMLEKGLVRRPT